MSDRRETFILAVAIGLAVDAGEPEAETLAGYVLRQGGIMAGIDGRPFAPPGSFWERLVDAAFRADNENLARIGAGFPGLAAMVEAFKNHARGVDALGLVAAHPITKASR